MIANIEKETLGKLKKLKKHPRESYTDVIERLLEAVSKNSEGD